MIVDLVLQENGMYATLVGILGGFAFAAVIQLIAMEKKGKLITATAILFSIATFMFLLALLAFVLIYAVVAETNTTFYALGTLGAYALFDTYGAVFVLLAGIGGARGAAHAGCRLRLHAALHLLQAAGRQPGLH